MLEVKYHLVSTAGQNGVGCRCDSAMRICLAAAAAAAGGGDKCDEDELMVICLAAVGSGC